MPSLFTITVATNSVVLDAKGHGEASFTVTNTSGRPVRGRASVASQNPAATPWLTLSGDVEGDFAIAGSQHYTVQIDVPAAAQPGSYVFGLNMSDVALPDENFTQGPTAQFVVPVRKPSFSWWIVAVAVALLVMVSAVFLVLNNQAAGRAAAATATATAELGAARATGTAQAATEVALTQTTASAQAAGTATAVVATTVQAAATQTVMAQATATAQTAAKFNGDWVKTTQLTVGVSRLQISNVGSSLSVQIFGDVRDVLGSNGGRAQSPCQPECAWDGTQGVQFADPLAVQVTIGSGLVHQLQITLSGKSLFVQDRLLINNRLTNTSAYTFERRCVGIRCDIAPFPTLFTK